MKTLQLEFTNTSELEQFINDKQIPNTNQVLIQIFYSGADKKRVEEINNSINTFLPNASIVGTSTAGVVFEGKIVDNIITVSFSIFESATVKSKSFLSAEIQSIVDSLEKDCITSDTKLLIMFANTFTFDASALLQTLEDKYPHIIIAGGNAGDDFRYEECYVFSNGNQSDIAIAAIDSKTLSVQTDYLFNWETIGESMCVTKSLGAIVYTIENKTALEIYEEYLGKDVVDNILEYGSEFPLIFNDNGITVARALVAFNAEDGSMTFAGNIPQGIDVKFGFGNIEHIKKKNKQNLLEKYKHRQESMFIYTCAARRHMLGEFLSDEISTLNSIAPNTGFVTYGEFFHNKISCNNNLLNITTTFILLNEKESKEQIKLENTKLELDKKDIRLNALTTLISKTSKKLDDNNYYLKQFKNAVDESAIYSTTDEQGRITDVNYNFELFSGYKKSELLGKSHNIIRHEDMKPEIFADMWKTIESGHCWNGLVKNRKKDGSNYYVISDITPIYYKDGTFREYVSICHDVSELEEYKELLKHELDNTSKNLKSSLSYTRQYENAINTAVAVLKTDINNVIKYANDKFFELSGYREDELIGMKCEDIRLSEHQDDWTCKKILKEASRGKVVDATLTNIAKDGTKFITQTVFYPLFSLEGKIIEYIQVLNDVTSIFELNKEIVNTQIEVVSTMGAIGETRSKETGLHVKRVAEYSYLLAILYGLDESDASLLKQASPMHDIGKVGIPDSILNKPGKLTLEEFDIIKTHSQLGYEMLKHSNRPILKASAVVAQTHHEKWDGRGYPNALKADEIPIFGRITAVADIFDALGHDRCYKKAWELDDILVFFKEERGRHFDPKLVDLFFDNLDKFLEIRDKFKDDDLT